jgi:predicted dehydrogenase
MARGSDKKTNQSSNFTRRDVLKTAAAASAVVAFSSNFAHAQGTDKLRVGVVGCGGRGSGAAMDCVTAANNVQIVALGDMFQERIDGIKRHLAKAADKVAVTDDKCFVGFDAYKKVIDSGVDLVILATPPGFRPAHIRAAAEAGKHVFAEKPVAVDSTGVRSVIESAEIFKQKNLGFVAGTQRRHQGGYVETIKRIQDGAIGDIVAAQCYWNQGGLWMHPRQSEWSDMEWQLRNWLYFTWLSGDHIVEQHVHQLDVMNWVMGATPTSAYGMGGRQVRTDPAYGHIFDHFAVEYVYPNGARVASQCRQQDGTDSRVAERVVGTKGWSDCAGTIRGETSYKHKPSEAALGPYVQEHKDLIDSIRAGKPLNECKQVAESTLTAIMGRMSAYTGKEVTWEQALNSKQDLTPKTLELGPIAVPPVPVPGKDAIV